jgi:hypothetical protein
MPRDGPTLQKLLMYEANDRLDFVGTGEDDMERRRSYFGGMRGADVRSSA